ncbi:MAG: InlB B-repeat-containing protein [Candidatus Cohnella colombiensis]|uniref:InlB B-repeat-containing protein n=1 Tax=Candidatus Cohnella colombiensis TaxID=3121368 RepID=A0AA95EYA8_9BACL|nr:MAG: InlB B-repeat-containing protein [Cohnella sp.]
MKLKNKKMNRICVWLIIVAMLNGMLPTSMWADTSGAQLNGLSNYVVELSSDPSTSARPSTFGTASDDGRVWADKSVSVNGTQFDVTLSALAQEYVRTTTTEVRAQAAADVAMVLDMSGSMTDVRITKMKNAVNKGIETIMAANPRNRIGIYYYGLATGSNVGTLFPLASYSTSDTGDKSAAVDRYVTSNAQTITRKAGVTQKYLDGATGTTTLLTISTSLGTATQYGLYTAINALKTDITPRPKSSADTERAPYVLLLTDGEANRAYPNWYNSPPDGTEQAGSGANGTAAISALTILSAAKLKAELTQAYSVHSGGKDAVWFNVAFGLDEGDNLATAILKPSKLASDATTNLKSVYTSLTSLTNSAPAAYKKYGIGGTPGYVYANEYIYFVAADDLTKVDEAMGALAGLVEAATQEKIIPFEQTNGSGEPLNLVVTDVLGIGMELKTAPQMGTVTGTVKSTSGSVTTYGFADMDTTVVYNSATREVKWIIPPKEVPLITFSSRKTPTPGSYSNPNLLPVKLTYSVGLKDAYASDTMYSNEYAGAGVATATTHFIPLVDNPYYYKNISNVGGNFVSTPKQIGSDIPSSVSKSSNTTGTATASYAYEWDVEGADNVFITKLGNNGEIAPKMKIEVTPTSSTVSAGGNATYRITVTNLTGSTISNVIVKNVLPSGLTFVTGSMKEDSVAKSSATFPYTIGSVPAGGSVELTFEATVPSNATAGTEYINDIATITSVGGTSLSTPATVTSDKVTVAATLSPRVTIKLDGANYIGQSVELWNGGASQYTLTASGGVHSASGVTPGTYDIYVNGVNTGVQLSNSDANKEINYYSASFYDGAQKYDTPATQTILSGGKAVLPTAPTKVGNTFDEWVTTNGGNTAFDFNTAITSTTNIYAKWTPNTNTAYKVNHYQAAVDGSYSVAPTVENLTGTTGGTTSAVAKTYTGFTAVAFTQGTIAADGSTVVNIYYTRNLYDITFVIDSTKGTATGDTSPEVAYGATPTAPVVTGKPGYTFTGWDKTIGAVIGDETYSAQFGLTDFAITYNLDDGSVTPANPGTYTMESTSITLNNPTKSGYTFSGWTGTDLTDPTTTVTIAQGSTGNRIYTATWTANTSIVTLDDNGGSGGSGNVTATYDRSMPVATAPSQAGYTLVGYFDQTSGGTKYYNADMSSAQDWDKTDSTVTLYAVWTEIGHVTIQYTTNNTAYGTVSMTYESLNPETGTTTGSQATAKLGYRFVEWQSANSNTVSTSAIFVPQKDSGSYVAATYTAVFAAEVYNITYNLDSGTTASSNPTTFTVADNDFTLTNPTKLGYTFTGWTGTGLSEPTITVKIEKGSTGDRIYTATWKVVQSTGTYIVIGTVVDDDTPPDSIPGATVEIVKGNTQYGNTAVTDANGKFTIYDVPGGIYDLKITLGEKTAIIAVTIGGVEQVVQLGNVIFPYNASSGLKLRGNDTPPIVIDNLHPEAVDYLFNEYSNTGFVKVEMTIEKIDETTNDADNLEGINRIKPRAQNDNLTIGLYLDMIIEKFYRVTEAVSWNSQGLIGQTNGLIKVIIPIPTDIQEKTGYTVYRYHGNAVNVISTVPNADGEYLVLDQSDWTLTLYVKNFSVYAIAYEKPAVTTIIGGTTSITITFNADGGTPSTTTQTVVLGDLLTKPADPKRTGYTFAGWYKTDGSVWNFSTDKVSSDLTLTAKWTIAKTNIPALDKVNHFAYMQGYPDKTFGPQKNMTRAEVTVMFARLLVEKMDVDKTYPSQFKDVDPAKWYANAIGYMEQYGIITGYTDGTFRPDAPITRAEFAAIASRFDNLITGEPVIFTDVTDSYWAKDYISSAAAKGWIKGYPDGTFKPGNYITRAEVVSLVNRMLERSSDNSYVDSNKDKLNQYVDLTSKHWAYYDIMEATNSHDYEKTSDSETWKSHTK